MDPLPGDVFDLVVGRLEPLLAPYASVSRAWQRSVEKRTWASLTVSSDELETFDALASDGRRDVVRKLVYAVELPSISKKRVKKLQGRRESAANDKAFTGALARLFATLHAWGPGSGLPLSLKLWPRMSVDDYTPYEHSPYRHCSSPVWRDRNVLAFLALDPATTYLPPVPRITALKHRWCFWARQIHPSALRVMADAMPGVRKMEWSFLPPPRRHMDLRVHIRSALADALLRAAFASLTDFCLDWHDDDPDDESFALESYVGEAGGPDQLTLAIRRVSRLPTLRKLDLGGTHILSADLFRLDPDDDGWPALAEWTVGLSCTTPDGQWYFTGDPADADEWQGRAYTPSSGRSSAAFDSDDSDTSDFRPPYAWDRLNGMLPYLNFRSRPHGPFFSPLVVALGNAVLHMPALKRLHIKFYKKSTCEINYLGPGQVFGTTFGYDKDKDHRNGRRWIIEMTEDFDSNWKMPADVRHALEASSGPGCIFFN